MKSCIWPHNGAWPHKQAVIKVIVHCLISNKRMVKLNQDTAVTWSRDTVTVTRAKRGTQKKF